MIFIRVYAHREAFEITFRMELRRVDVGSDPKHLYGTCCRRCEEDRTRRNAITSRTLLGKFGLVALWHPLVRDHWVRERTDTFDGTCCYITGLHKDRWIAANADTCGSSHCNHVTRMHREVV